MKSIACTIITSLALVSSCLASWISEITGVDVDVNNGTIKVDRPKPEAIVPMLQNLPKDVAQAVLNPAGSALAVAIRNARAQADGSAQPIPDDLRSVLTRYIPAKIVEKARWTSYDPARWSLDSVILGMDQALAVTVDDIIIFKHGGNPRDVPLLVHELVHVMQYQNMGVESFANLYSLDHNGLEGPAYALQDRVKRDQDSGQTGSISLSSSAPIGSSQLAPDAFRQAAMNVWSALSWVKVTGYAFGYGYLLNTGPVAVRIDGWTQQTPLGEVVISNFTPFILQPGGSGAVTSAYPGPIVQLFVTYAQLRE